MISMPKVSSHAAMAVLALGLVAGPLARPASASSFNVNPTQVFLTGKATSALLTVRNESEDTLRFQLSAFAWDQSPSGELLLAPTQDIVFYPALITLAPNEERKVRIGRTTAMGDKEKTYRIFVEEMPPLEEAGASGAAVHMLTKMGIPIFVRPGKETSTATISGLERQGDVVHFSLSNSGTVHFIPQQVTVKGMSGDRTVFEQKLDGWYVLAGGRRDFKAAVPKDTCAKVTSLLVEIAISSSRLNETLDTPSGACMP
jgi:fimbrial chaperone protein